MKSRISATVDDSTVEILKELVRKKKYRNHSHAVETAIELLAEKEKNE